MNSYHIPRKNCEHDFRIGEQITIVYATTRILKENGIYAPLRMVGGVPMRLSDPGPGYYVIYAFAGDETEFESEEREVGEIVEDIFFGRGSFAERSGRREVVASLSPLSFKGLADPLFSLSSCFCGC